MLSRLWRLNTSALCAVAVALEYLGCMCSLCECLLERPSRYGHALRCFPEFCVVLGFIGVEFRLVAQGEADVVEAVNEAVLTERVDVEVGIEALVVGDGLVDEGDGDLVLRIGGAALEQGLNLFFAEAGEDNAVLAGVGVEDVGEGGGDDGAEAVLEDGPGGVLAGAAATEVLFDDEDLGTLVLGLVEDEVGVGLAGGWALLDAAPVVEEEVAVAGALDALEKLLRDDLVRVDVRQRERCGSGGEGDDGLHRVPLGAKCPGLKPPFFPVLFRGAKAPR
jgi:hypothetical protein